MADHSPMPQPGPLGISKADRAAAEAYKKAQRPWWKKKRVVVPGVFVLLTIIGSLDGNKADDHHAAPTAIATTSPASVTQAPTLPAKPPTAQSPRSVQPAAVKSHAAEVAAPPAETSGQANAREAAARYLAFAPFSRLGLIDQLASSAGDGYSIADATYGVDAQHVNWNEQAYLAAKKYLGFSPFSRQGLIAQLESSAGDKYTHAQAVYGATKALSDK